MSRPSSRLPPAREPGSQKRTGALKQQAYEAIKRRIISGELSVGEFLSERELTGSLGMSKTPIRVALERLELEGFVRISPQRGVVVRDLTVDEIADQFEIRLALEGFALEQLAGCLLPDQVARIEENLECQVQAAENSDLAEMVRLDTEFHMLLCEFLGNREICRVMAHQRDRIAVVIRRVFRQSGTERLHGSLEEHRGIARAVITGKPELALKRLKKHLEYGKRSLVSPRRP